MNEHERQIFCGQIDKNSLQVIKAHLVPWKSQWYVDLRIWEKADGEGNEKPTIRGMRFNSEIIGDLMRLLEETRRRLEAGPEVVFVQDGKPAGES